MLFLLDWTETDIPEDGDNGKRHPTQQACAPEGEATDKQSSKDAGVQPLGYGCENVILHPGLVEITPILSEHYTQNMVLREKGKEPALHILGGISQPELLCLVWRKFCREGGAPLTMAILQACLPPCRGGVQTFSNLKNICNAWWSFSSMTPELHQQINWWHVQTMN